MTVKAMMDFKSSYQFILLRWTDCTTCYINENHWWAVCNVLWGFLTSTPIKIVHTGPIISNLDY